MKKDKENFFSDTLRTVIYAVLIALVIRTFAFEPFNIPSRSMVPTLLVGDYLFVSKYSYGYSRYSLPLGLALFPGRIFASSPERGDVLVFKWPGDNTTDYIKRVIGLPGDRIQVIGGLLYINDKVVKRKRIEDFRPESLPAGAPGIPQYVEILPNGVSYRTLDQGRSFYDDTKVYTVPSGQYFMMGDNRDASADSREWGFVPAVNLVGRAEILFFSTNGTARLWEVWRWPSATRFNRLFKFIN